MTAIRCPPKPRPVCGRPYLRRANVARWCATRTDDQCVVLGGVTVTGDGSLNCCPRRGRLLSRLISQKATSPSLPNIHTASVRRILTTFLLLVPALVSAQTIELSTGLNVFSFPREVPSEASSCFALLAYLGGPSSVERIESLDAPKQLFKECSFVAGTPSGDDFPIESGRGYLVYALNAIAFEVSGSFACPEVNLEPGMNLLGVPSPGSGLSCFDLLESLGASSAAAVERFDRESGVFEACSFSGGDRAGSDFPIVGDAGYIIHMEGSIAGFNPNDINDLSRCPQGVALTCQLLDPESGVVGSTVTISGSGFIPGSTTVDFNGVDVAPFETSFTRLRVTVPPGTLTGSVTIQQTPGGRLVGCGEFQVERAPSVVATNGRQLIVRKRRPDGTLAQPEPYVMRGVGWSPASADTNTTPSDRKTP